MKCFETRNQDSEPATRLIGHAIANSFNGLMPSVSCDNAGLTLENKAGSCHPQAQVQIGLKATPTQAQRAGDITSTLALKVDTTPEVRKRRSLPLDGIRGIAVLMVLCFHYGYFGAGWIGVQLFFTLSGYLISTILLESRSSSFLVYFGTFYWHRALRILPVVYGFLLVCGAVYALSKQPSSLPSDWPWLVLFVANFARMRLGDLGPPFVHLWSLAVEQQFYLIWPILIFFLPRRSFRAVVAGILILTPLVRYAVFQYLVHIGWDTGYAGTATYVLPFTQFDAFAAGAAISLWSLDHMRNAGRWFLLMVAIVGVAGFAVLLSEHTSGRGAYLPSFGYAMLLIQAHGYVWAYSLLNIVSMLGIVCALQSIGPKSVLQSRCLVWIGKISYGVYVYHLPLLLLGKYWMDHLHIVNSGVIRPIFFIAWVGLTIGVSDFSYRRIETPFLNLKNFWQKRARVTQSLIGKS